MLKNCNHVPINRKSKSQFFFVFYVAHTTVKIFLNCLKDAAIIICYRYVNLQCNHITLLTVTVSG